MGVPAGAVRTHHVTLRVATRMAIPCDGMTDRENESCFHRTPNSTTGSAASSEPTAAQAWGKTKHRQIHPQKKPQLWIKGPDKQTDATNPFGDRTRTTPLEERGK